MASNLLIDPEPLQPSSTRFLRSFLTTLCVLPIFFLTGTELGQSAGMLPQLLDENSFIKINMEEATWIASTPIIGNLLTSSLGGWLSDKFGRIRLGQVGYLFFFGGFATMVRADSFKTLVIGRFFTGLGLGCSVGIQIYISEIAPPVYRGILLSLAPLMSAFGTVFMYLFGGYMPWKIGAGLTCIISIFGLVLTFFFYDSPVWLVRNNRIDDARKSIKRIDGSANVNAKLREILKTPNCRSECNFKFRVLAEPTIWKPFTMIMLLSVLQNASGYYIVITYTVQIMKEFHTAYDPLQSTVAVGVVKFFAMLLTSFLIRHGGRKSLGAVSGFSSALMLLLIYAYLKYESEVSFVRENSWIPVALFFTYITTMTLGIYPLPWTVVFEIFPIKVRGMMGGVCCCAMNLAIFTAMKSYNRLLVYLGIDGMILMFAVSSLAFGLFSMMILVETHDKTLHEIEAIFAGRKETTDESERVNLTLNTPVETATESARPEVWKTPNEGKTDETKRARQQYKNTDDCD